MITLIYRDLFSSLRDIYMSCGLCNRNLFCHWNFNLKEQIYILSNIGTNIYIYMSKK